MTFKEALEHKKESVKTADESVLKLYHLIIVPADTSESVDYISEFLKDPEKFDDKSCRKFSSEDHFEVVSILKEEK